MPTANAIQIENALKYTMTGSLVNGAAIITDSTQYAGIGIAAPDTVLVLLQILDPTGNLFYQNANWNSGTFTSPDLSPIAGIGAGFTTYSFTMPTDINGDYLTGQYTINLQVEVVQGSLTIIVQNTQYATICNCCNGISINVTGNVSYNTAQISVTDNTQYGAYITLNRVMTLYAPPTALQAPQTGTNITTLLWSPPMGTFPSTGTWTWKLVSTITYIDTLTQAETTCAIVSEGTFDVVQSQLCVVLCQLNEWRAKFYKAFANKNTTQLIQDYNLACNEYVLALAATQCGRPQTQINGYIQEIYKITGIDPNCPCSCNNGVGQPLVPTNAINGTNGLNGTNFLQGVGAPGNGLGAVGDSYLDSTADNIYKKTGATTWTITGNIKGADGAAGATGPAGIPGAPGSDGSNGVAILHNDLTTTNNGSVVGSVTPLKSYSLSANTLVTNGSKITIASYIENGDVVDLGVQISIGGLVLVDQLSPAILPSSGSIQNVYYELSITKTGTGTACWALYYETTAGNNVIKSYRTLTNIPISVDWTILNSIVVSGKTASASAALCRQLEVDFYQFGTGVVLPTIYGTYPNPTAAIAANVPVGGTYITTATGAYTILQ